MRMTVPCSTIDRLHQVPPPRVHRTRPQRARGLDVRLLCSQLSMGARSTERPACQFMSSMQAEATLSQAASSGRATLRASRQTISRCTSSVSLSSKGSAPAVVLVALSSMARTVPSRRRQRNWSRVCSLNPVEAASRGWFGAWSSSARQTLCRASLFAPVGLPSHSTSTICAT